MSNPPIQTPGQRSILDHTPLFRPSSGLTNASSSSSARRQSLPVSARQADAGRPSSQGSEPRRKKKKRKTTHGAEAPRGSRLALGDGDWEDEDDPGYEVHQKSQPPRSQIRYGNGPSNAVAGPSRLPAQSAKRPRVQLRNAEAGPSRPTPSHPGPRLSQQAASSSTTLPQSTTHTSHKRPRAPISPATGPRHHRFVARTQIPSHVVSPSSRPAKKPRMSAPAALHPRLSLGATQGFTVDEPIELDLSDDEAEQGRAGSPVPVSGPPVSVERLVGMLPGMEPRRASPAQEVSSQLLPVAVPAAPRQSAPEPDPQSSRAPSLMVHPTPPARAPPPAPTVPIPLSPSQPTMSTSMKPQAPRRPRAVQPRASLPNLPPSNLTLTSATTSVTASSSARPPLDDLLTQWQATEAARKSRQDADVFSADYQRSESSSSRTDVEKAERVRRREEEEVAEGLFTDEDEESPEPIEQGPVVSQALSQVELNEKARKLIDALAAGQAASRPISGTPTSSTSAPRPQPPPSQSPSQLKASDEARLASEAAEKERDAEAEAVALREIAEETEEERCISAFLQLSQEEVDFDGEVARDMGRRARRDAIEKECERMREEERDEAAVREWDIREAKLEAERLEQERLKAVAAAKAEKERIEKERKEAEEERVRQAAEKKRQKEKEKKEKEEAEARRKAQREAYDRAEAERAAKAAADALALEKLAKKAAEAKTQAEAEAKLEKAAKAREEREAKEKAEKKAAFLRRSQEEQQAASGSRAVDEWRKAERLRVEKEKRKEIGERAREDEERKRAEQEEKDLQSALQLSQEEAARVAEQKNKEKEREAEKRVEPVREKEKSSSQLEKERVEKEKAEKAAADAASQAARLADESRRKDAERQRLASAKEADAKRGREVEAATLILEESRYWRIFDKYGGAGWDETLASRALSYAVRDIKAWRDSKFDEMERAASVLRAATSIRDTRSESRGINPLLLEGDEPATEILDAVRAQKAGESAEAKEARIAAERQAIGPDWRLAHELAAQEQVIRYAENGREALHRRRATATEAQRSLLAKVVVADEGRRGMAEIDAWLTSSQFMLDIQAAFDAARPTDASAGAKKTSEVKKTDETPKTPAEQRSQEIAQAFRDLREAEYWKLFQTQGGQRWDEAACRKAWAAAGQTINSWREAEISAAEERRSIEQAAAVLFDPQVAAIVRSNGEGLVRSAALSRARAEAVDVVTKQRAKETPTARDRRVATERQAHGSGDAWRQGLADAVDEKAVEWAAEKRDSLVRRRGRATEADRAMFALVHQTASGASQSSVRSQAVRNASIAPTPSVQVPQPVQPRPTSASQRAATQPAKPATAPTSATNRLSSSIIPDTASTAASAAKRPAPQAQTARLTTQPRAETTSLVSTVSAQTSTPSTSNAAPQRPSWVAIGQPEVVIPSAPAPPLPSTQQARVELAFNPPLDQHDPNDGLSEPSSPITTEKLPVQPDAGPSRSSQKRPAQPSRSQEDDEPAPIVRQRKSRILFDSDDETVSSSSGVRVAALAKRKKMEKVASLVLSDEDDADDDDHAPINRPRVSRRGDEGHSPTVPVHRMRRSVPSTSRKGKEKAVPVIVMDDEDEEEEAVEEVEDEAHVRSFTRSAATEEAMTSPPRFHRTTRSTQSADPRVRPRIAVIPPTQSSHGQSQPKATEEEDQDLADGGIAAKDIQAERAKDKSVAAALQSATGPLFQTPTSRSNPTSLSKPLHSSSSAVTAVSSPKPAAVMSDVQRLLSLRKDESVDQALNGVWSKVHRLTASSAAPPSPSTTAASRQSPLAILRVSRDLAPSTSHTTVFSTTSTEVDVPRSDSTVPTEVSLQTATSATATDRNPSISKVEQFHRSQASASAAVKALQDKFPRVEIRNGATSAAPKSTRASTRNMALPFFEEQGNDHDGDWETETEQDSRPASPAPRRRTRGSRTTLSVTGSEVTDSPSARRRSARNSGRTKSYVEKSLEEFDDLYDQRPMTPTRVSRSRAAIEATETSPPPQPRPKPSSRPAYIPTTRPSSLAGPSSRPFPSSEQAAVPASADVDYDVDILRKYGLFCPTMKGRKNNKWTSWSTNVQPGTLMDLMWELDLLYMPGDRERPLMKRMEDEVIWGDMREVSDKRRFLNCCWARWSKERGPLRADLSAEFVHNFIDKYGEIMRFAGLDREVTDMIHILNKQGLVGFDTYIRASEYWNRHMRYYRKMKDRSLPLDADWSDCEDNMARGRIRLKEFEEGGREYAEMVERRRARAEGRAPVLPKEKYVFGMDEEKDVGQML